MSLNLRLILKTLISIISNNRGSVDVGGGNANSDGGSVQTPEQKTSGDTSGGNSSGQGPESRTDSNTDGSKRTISFPANLPEELKDHPAFNAFKTADGYLDYGNMMKSYVHQQKLIGGDKILVPNNKFTDEQWKETFHKLGVPKELNDYSIKNNIPEGHDMDADLFDGFKQIAHASGILPKQAQAVVDYYNKAIASKIDSYKTSSKEQTEKIMNNLKSKWGDQFDKNVNYANQAINNFGDEEIREHIKKNGYDKDPVMLKYFSEIGKALTTEDSVFNDETKHNFGMSVNEMMDRESKLYKEITSLDKFNPSRQSKMAELNAVRSKRLRAQGVDPDAPIGASFKA